MDKNTDKKMPLFPPWPMGFPPVGPIVTDPNGSYTGRPLEQTEIPVQDVDDL